MRPLEGQVAVVTGASRGIGLASAIALAEAGAHVALNFFQSRDELDEGLAKIAAAGVQGIALQADVADQAAVEKMVADAVKHLGKLTIAVSNAAYSDRQLFHEADMAGFRRTLDVTMWGAFNLVRAATKQMISQGAGGSIVVIGSPHAYTPVPRSMAYNMSKAAVEQMARTAAIELVEQRIRVNLVTPGWIDTPGERKFFDDEAIRKAGEKLPWKRLGRVDEIARGVAFLCDPASDYITGSSLLIDGGITLPWWASRGSGVPE